MTTTAQKIDSNTTGVRFCEEDRTQAIGNLPAVAKQVWYQLEPNTETNFGGNVKTVSRMPIDASRQMNKGVVVDLDVEGSINHDMVLGGVKRLMQGFFFANLREAPDSIPYNGNATTIGNVSAAGHSYSPTLGNGIVVVTNDLLFASGFSNNANNGLQVVSTATFTAASGNLTASTQFTNADTVTIGNRTYTIQANLTAGDGHVHLGGNATVSITNLVHAINNSGGTPGTDYNVAAADPNVSAAVLGTSAVVTALNTGAGGNAIATTTTSGNASWAHATLINGADTVVVVNTNVVDEPAPPATARLECVGFQGTSGDLSITNSLTAYPTLNSVSLDFTTLPLIPGQWIWIGGDATGTAYTSHTTNNGWARINSIAAHVITFDKTGAEMVTDTGTGLTIQIFWGKTLKNEALPAFQVRRSYTIERTLGAPDPQNNPSILQAEYLEGAVPNELTVNVSTAAKVTYDMSFMACTKAEIGGNSTILSTLAVNGGGSAPTASYEDVFNTTSHVNRARMSVVSASDSYPTSLFAELTELKVVLKNNLKANKAIKKLGAFDLSAGFFEVTSSVQVYFNDIAAMQAVRSGADVTADIAFAHANQGLLIDLPLMSLGDARADVKINEAIMLPLTMQLGRDKTFNHTLLMEFFSYLPTLAMPSI